MAKVITYTCDDCQKAKYQIINDQDKFPPGWYSSISNMGRSVKILCPDCYKRMCMTDNGFLGGD